MPALSTVILCWAAVYAYVGAYYCMLYARRRQDREYLYFGLISSALALHSVASAVLVAAPSMAVAALAMRIDLVAAIAAVPFLVDFAHDVRGTKNALRPVAYAWSALGLLGVVLGLMVEPAEQSPFGGWGFDWAPDYHEARVRPLGYVHLGIGGLLIGWSLLQLWPRRGDSGDERVVFRTSLVSGLAAGHDVLVRAFGLRSPYLLEHLALLGVLGMSYVLLRRFARTAEDLRALTGELTTSHDALRRTQERLVHKEQLAAVGELSAVIAHEVRNPLAIIKNAVSGLRRTKLRREDRFTLLDILDEETDRLNRLMHDLLAYARPVMPKGQDLDVEEVVASAITRARSGHPHADRVALDLRLAEGPRTLHGDPDLLRHALVNIVDNAHHAMAKGGTLTVTSRPARLREHDAVAIDFEDTGEGMDTLVRKKATDPFFTTRPSGTGLGLAIVERVIRNHGGRVEIESRHGLGTRVTVVLPLSRISLVAIPPPEGGLQLLSLDEREAP